MATPIVFTNDNDCIPAPLFVTASFSVTHDLLTPCELLPSVLFEPCTCEKFMTNSYGSQVPWPSLNSMEKPDCYKNLMFFCIIIYTLLYFQIRTKLASLFFIARKLVPYNITCIIVVVKKFL